MCHTRFVFALPHALISRSQVLPIRPSLLLLACLGALAAPASRSGIALEQIDRTVRPQDNLFLAANGAWQKSTEIPADQSSWGVDEVLNQKCLARVRDLVENVMRDHPQDVDAQRLNTLYASFMDEAGIAQRGLTPLQGLLDEIEALPDRNAVFRAFGRLERLGIGNPVGLSVSADAKDASHYALYIAQGGLGLPGREYYLDKDPRFSKARIAYQQYLTRLLELAHYSNAANRAKAVIRMEADLARIQWSETQNRNDSKVYNRFDRAGLVRLGKNLPWQSLFDATGVPASVDLVIVQQPTYVEAFQAVLQRTPVSVWKDYLLVGVLDRFAPLLPSEFVEANFRLHDKELGGVQAMPARWQRGVDLVNEHLGEAAGRLYVGEYFPPSAKARMENLVGNLLKAYGDSIDQLGWMSPATKARAHEKLAHYGVKIGYPDHWRDYSNLQFEAGDLIGNVLRASEVEFARDIARIGKPVDHGEWSMTPQTVNAYYEPTGNEIVFPAAILQPPYFDPEADDAANYGATGATIGHEISHGFDDQGSLYDAFGNMRNWWRPRDHRAFDRLTSRLVTQYNRYQPLPGRHINGQLTLGENIADVSGLQIAYKAYHLALGNQTAPTLDGYSGDQRFFLAFAQSWNTKRRDALTLQLLTTDPHSPEQFRANGAAENADGFHDAFQTKPGDAMYKHPNERIRIW
jgi:putative endopeptidase